MTLEPIRILIADDHPIVRDGLRALLATIPQAELVGQATTAEEAIEAAAELLPDVVVMDLRIPEGDDGIQATRRITAASPHIGVLVFTMAEDDDSVFAAIRAGARGYVLKEANRSEIIRAIEAVASGEAIFSPAIARRVMEYFAAQPSSGPAPALPQLTGREREVLILMTRGASNLAVAQRLGLSPKTVRNHVSNIFHKLQVADRYQALMKAREAGLGEP